MLISRQEAGVGAATVGAATSGPSDLAPILAFVGVIIVALLTAYFTKQRQVDQPGAEKERQKAALKAEKERLDAALEAESSRLQRRLDHDRRLQDLAELRTIVDQTLQDAETAKNLFLDCRRVATRPEFEQDLYGKAYDLLQQAKKPLSLSFVRITAGGHEQLAYAISEFSGKLKPPNLNYTVAADRDKRHAWDAAVGAVSDWHATLINLSRTLVASQLPESAGSRSAEPLGPAAQPVATAS